MGTINPYELLGVNVNSTLQELKRNYYDLATLIHPDRSGTDTTHEMIVLKNSYEFVKKELLQTNHILTFEELQDNFKNFCKVQEETIPEFREIHDDRFDFFNTRFDELKDHNSTTDGGYGDMMEESEYRNESKIRYEEKAESPIVTHEFNNIVEYKALDGLPSYSSCLDYTQEKIENYGGEVDGIGMTDYKEAYTPAAVIDIEEPVAKSIEEYCEARQTDDVLLEDRMLPDLKWGHNGLVDEHGNRLTNFLRLKL